MTDVYLSVTTVYEDSQACSQYWIILSIVNGTLEYKIKKSNITYIIIHTKSIILIYFIRINTAISAKTL